MGTSLLVLWDLSLVWKGAQPCCIRAGLNDAVRFVGQQEQFFLSPTPYVWWLESNLLPEGGGTLAALCPS